MAFSDELMALFARDLGRLAKEVRAFPDDDALWHAMPGVVNPAGNLALHIEGNLREFVGRQIGGVAYTRVRPAEFGTRGLTREDVAARIEAVRDGIIPCLAAADWDAVYPENVLGEPLTTRQFVTHLYGHLNYHLGQVNYLRRIAHP